MRTLWIALVATVAAGALAFTLTPKGSRPAAWGPDDFDHAGLPVTELEGAAFTEDQALGLPGALRVLGEHLVIVDRLGGPGFHVIARATGALVASGGREGEGPGEFRAPVALDPAPGGDGFWVFDLSLQRLTKVAFEKGAPPRDLSESPMVHLRADAPVLQPVWIDAHRLLAHGFFLEGRLAAFDGAGRLLRFAGPLPPNPGEVPANVLQHAYQGTLGGRPDRSRLVLVTRHAGSLEIYRADGTLLRRARGPYSFEPRFSVRAFEHGPAMASGEDLRFGYIDVATTHDRIYALFSGRTRAGFPGRANYAEYVHVFDWEGRFLEALKLDADAFTIAVDEKEGALYAVRHLPAPGVLRYPLPSARPKR